MTVSVRWTHGQSWLVHNNHGLVLGLALPFLAGGDKNILVLSRAHVISSWTWNLVFVRTSLCTRVTLTCLACHQDRTNCRSDDLVGAACVQRARCHLSCVVPWPRLKELSVGRSFRLVCSQQRTVAQRARRHLSCVSPGLNELSIWRSRSRAVHACVRRALSVACSLLLE